MTTTMGVDAEASAMPAAFLGHGSPMNALEHNRYTEAWRRFGASVPRPRAILVISAHWYINATAVTAMRRPRVIHDFYGFPAELYRVDYAAPGDPAVAERVAEVVKPRWVGLDVDSWGLDHGTWSVLTHAFPDARIPVLQLSVNAAEPVEYHFEIGQRLEPLRREGVLIIGSGNVVHNLQALSWDSPDTGFAWARRFDEAARHIMHDSPEDIARLTEGDDAKAAMPTPDHFLPLAYVAGLSAAAGSPSLAFAEGYAYGSLSMTCYALGTSAPPEVSYEAAAGEQRSPLRPSMAPADETNL